MIRVKKVRKEKLTKVTGKMHKTAHFTSNSLLLRMIHWYIAHTHQINAKCHQNGQYFWWNSGFFSISRNWIAKNVLSVVVVKATGIGKILLTNLCRIQLVIFIYLWVLRMHFHFSMCSTITIVMNTMKTHKNHDKHHRFSCWNKFKVEKWWKRVMHSSTSLSL